MEIDEKLKAFAKAGDKPSRYQTELVENLLKSGIEQIIKILETNTKTEINDDASSKAQHTSPAQESAYKKIGSYAARIASGIGGALLGTYLSRKMGIDGAAAYTIDTVSGIFAYDLAAANLGKETICGRVKEYAARVGGGIKKCLSKRKEAKVKRLVEMAKEDKLKLDYASAIKKLEKVFGEDKKNAGIAEELSCLYFLTGEYVLGGNYKNLASTSLGE